MCQKSCRARIVSTIELIVDVCAYETVTGIFIRSKNLKLAVEYGDELLASLEMLEVDEKAFPKTWKIFSEQANGELSFTDSTAIAVMKNHDITRIGTFDRDFGEIKVIDAIG